MIVDHANGWTIVSEVILGSLMTMKFMGYTDEEAIDAFYNAEEINQALREEHNEYCALQKYYENEGEIQ